MLDDIDRDVCSSVRRAIRFGDDVNEKWKVEKETFVDPGFILHLAAITEGKVTARATVEIKFVESSWWGRIPLQQ